MQVSSLSSSAPTTAPQESALSGLTNDFDMFLTLLTTQLQNQNPLDPMDTEQMTSQLIQFANVEQTIKQSSLLESLVNLQTASADAAAVAYIGHEALVEGSETNLTSSGAQFAYNLDLKAADTTVNILNAAGKLVYSTNGETGVGRHEFQWDGTDADGEASPLGTYSMRVSAINDAGDGLSVDYDVTGTVTGVQSGENGPQILIGDVVYDLSAVQKVTTLSGP